MKPAVGQHWISGYSGMGDYANKEMVIIAIDETEIHYKYIDDGVESARFIESFEYYFDPLENE